MEHKMGIPSFVTGAVALGLIACISSLAFPSLSTKLTPRRSNNRDKIHKIYEDEDGVATETSQNEYYTALPRSSLLASSIIGTLASIAGSIFSTLRPNEGLYIEGWLTVGSWTVLSLLALNIFFEHHSVNRYNLGAQAAVAYFIIISAVCAEYGLLAMRPNSERPSRPCVVSAIIQSVTALISLLSCLLLPRRPSVYYQGHAVDKQYSVSAINRWTWRWAAEYLALARVKGLVLDDLPKLHLHMRSNYLCSHFRDLTRRDRLWKTLLMAHHWEIVAQSVLSVAQGIVQFGPQLAMYKFLELLETSHDTPVQTIAWAWVVGLGASLVLASWMEVWLHWIVLARLGLPIRTELSALVFTKSMRRKDVKGVQMSKKITDAIIQNETNANEDVQESRQSIINLIAVDAKRISDFATFYYVFPQSATKFAVSMVFLIQLIGWKSVLAGMAVFVLITPFNVYVSSRYGKDQIDMMTARDRKMAFITEALQGIRQIKFSALERQWQAKIGAKRTRELAAQRRVFLWDTLLISIWILGPVMLSAVSLAAYSLLHGTLLPSVAFTTITVFAQIEAVLAIIPDLIGEGLEAWVSTGRIEKYLGGSEKNEYIIPGAAIAFKNASIAWPSDSEEEESDRFMLRNISIMLPEKELTVISGKTGSGKTLLLASILGEADLLKGKIIVPKAPSAGARHDYAANRSDWIIDSAIAYVAQIPWIENATIKDNILFDLPYDAGRYNEVISSCALVKDLEMLPEGEMTDIGANGINLSGGQKWRISLARALYSRAGILVLDDIFSAVDAHVGRHLFEKALTGNIGIGRTRILVTHHLNLCLPKTKYTVILGEGTVEHAGYVEELRETGKLEQVLLPEKEGLKNLQTSNEDLLVDDDVNMIPKVLSRADETSINTDNRSIVKMESKKFTEDEKRETGAVKLEIYREYIKTSGGWLFWTVVGLMFFAHQGLILGTTWWMSLWTRSYSQKSHSFLVQHSLFDPYKPSTKASDTITRINQNSHLSYYLSIYFLLSVLICITGTLRYFFVLMGSLRASRTLFKKLTYAVLRAPLRWSDTVPVGRILNRFSADFAVVDSRMGLDLGFMLYQIIQLLGIIVAGVFVSSYMLLASIILSSLCVFIALRFLPGAREVKRLESNARSPIFEQFGSALTGIGTIRAFDKTNFYVERMFKRIDEHVKASWYMWLFNRWLALNLDAVSAAFAILISAVIVFTKGIDASLAGFALSFALQYSSAMTWTIRQYSSVELGMNATERIVEYSKIPIEDQFGVGARLESDENVDIPTVPAAWPTEGRLEVEGLVVRYAPDLPPVLKGLSFTVAKNQRIGVVGRTGAGKSSLTLALFRFLEASAGSISIDGVDISTIGLHDLRSRLAIIPQDPVLFSGTLRSNLDAFDDHNDSELYDALERVQLIQSSTAGSGSTSPATLDTNVNMFKSLSSQISEGGLNLSQGQRQLLCLARAIVSRPKIMVLDEATSAVDMATDFLIQRSIRAEFKNSTLLVIAHRLSTIADFDRILVMSDGKAVEFGTPIELLEKRGLFWEMVGHSGEKDKLEEIILRKLDRGNGER